MSELEKTAPNEIYLIVGDADKDCNFNELEEVTWADKPIYEETAIKYVKSSRLTIPKSVADELDKTTLLDFVDEIKSYDDLSYKLFDYVKPFESDIKDNWYEIFLAYFNPLTRDLVKVVEG